METKKTTTTSNETGSANKSIKFPKSIALLGLLRLELQSKCTMANPLWMSPRRRGIRRFEIWISGNHESGSGY
ncbi:hypothetical protein YC2023_059683 [Brassica napus]